MKLTYLATALLSAAASLTTAAPGPRPNVVDDEVPARFTVRALRSASPIHYMRMQARRGGFWLGGQPSTYCPQQVGDACPEENNFTAIAGLRSLDVMVPGGQAIYVAPSGALSFTTAHSAYIPPGSAVTGFKYTAHETEEGRGTYGFNGMGAKGWMACPSSKDEKPEWQVFAAMRNATVPTGDTKDCLGFSGMASTYDPEPNEGPIAWQYI